MEFFQTQIPGCFEIRPPILKDKRGVFVKTFHKDIFHTKGLGCKWAEEYYSVSYRGVLRGLHFQLPPHDHEKLVYCPMGEIMDVVVDLRVGSPAFGRHVRINLSAKTANMVYIPRGLAHGFLTTSESATLIYKVSSVYAPQYDSGIHWDSAGISWPIEIPITSERDQKFLSFNEFKSPFIYVENI